MFEYQVPFGNTVLQGDRWTPPDPICSALLLHGGGTSGAAGFRELRTYLYAQHVETLAFDCIGHGRTGGPQLGTTLKDRVEQVHAVIDSQRLEVSGLAIIGFSMGAYVALKAAVEAGVPRLGLAIPAAYATQAYGVPFGPEFSRILRAPRSWENSDAFEIAREYTGHLLVVSAEEDKVVPGEIPQKYASSPSKRTSTVHHVVKGSGHDLSAHYELEPLARASAYAQIALLCRRGDA
jgi:uncharacterized protein